MPRLTRWMTNEPQALRRYLQEGDKAWCPYCIMDALTHLATLGLTLPAAARAVRHLRGSRR